MKKVAGFHSLLFGFASASVVRDLVRNDFGIIVRQKSGCSIVGRNRVDACLLAIMGDIGR